MTNKSRVSILKRKIKSFWSYPLADQLMMPCVWVLLGCARMVILLIPFRYYSRVLGRHVKTEIYTPVLLDEKTAQARRIGRIVRATAKITPWESLCLAQAIVACTLLRLAGTPYIMHFGLAKNTDDKSKDPMKAHAWVTAGPVAVTGGRSLFQFAVVGSYVSPL